MKSLLITGGAGFIGSNLVRYIFEKTPFKGEILNLDKLTYAGNLDNLKGIQESFGNRYKFYQVDLCDRARLKEVFKENTIDAICHLAAESHVDRSILGPGEFIQTNIIGTFNLLEMARSQSEIKRFHHVSTDEVFGSLGAEGAFVESSPYQPNSPYSASKAASDHLVRAYHRTYGLPATLSNCSNNYGPYQFPEKLIPLVILNALEEESIPIYGDGGQIRDWLHVEDHCRALWSILNRGKVGETYNVGGEGEITNLELVKKICLILDELCPNREIDNFSDLLTFVEDRPGHDRRYAINYSKINGELSWEPQENLNTGLRKTVSWYLANLNWVKNIQSGDYQKWIDVQYSRLLAN